MKLTIIHPAIGHKLGEKYIRSWQMEPLPAAAIAGLTPADVDVVFYDDRMEKIPFDEKTDAVAISVETYTAKRAYQIASEYRKRNIPVIMGGFHASLMPQEVERYAEAVIVGEAEAVWSQVIDDLRNGTLQKRYKGVSRPSLERISVDRSIFKGKNYIPIGLVESGRGCPFPCDFCAIQTVFERSYRSRAVDSVVEEIRSLKGSKKIFFFVDDNFAGRIKQTAGLLEELKKQNIRWVTQMSIHAAHDEDFLARLSAAGCKGVLIGFESLNPDNLAAMNKQFNMMKGGYQKALDNLRRHDIRVYATFVFGYDHDTVDSFRESVDFAIEQDFYIAAFNHLTPFPGTPLYKRFVEEKKLRFDAWWLDDNYRYNDIPFQPAQLSPAELTSLCVDTRREFYSWKSILKRSMGKTNRSDGFMFRNFFPINAMHRSDVNGRNGYPLGDETWQGELLEAMR